MIFAIALAAVWGFNFITIEVGLGDFPPILFAALRFLLAAFPAVLFVGRGGVPWRWILAVAATIGIGQYVLLFIGMRAGMPAGLSSLVLQAQALFTPAFAVVLLGERLTVRRVAGLAVAFAGLVIIVLDLGAAGPIGAFLLVVGAAASWALGNIATRKASPPDTLRFMVWVSAMSTGPLFALSLWAEGPAAILDALATPTATGLASLGYVAWISTLGGFGLWGWLIRRYDASTVSPYSLLVPVFGMSSAALITGETITPLKAVAGVLIIAGVLYAGSGARRAARTVSAKSAHEKVAV